ncbi:kinase-like domain-containing protein, partial [Fomitopsis betulina]
QFMDTISKPSRLHNSLFHTLRKICTTYGSLPISLFLQPETITADGTNTQATGGSADIYRAYYLMLRMHVCVKVVRLSDRELSSGTRMKDICKEALMWKHVSHPNTTPFYGLVNGFNGRSGIGMICKWMPNGHVIEFLQHHGNANRLSLLLDAARGLGYLHSESVSIVHGDLKGTNVLVDERGRACLSDFGLSSVLYGIDTPNTATSVSSFRSTLRWMAPELHDPEHFGLDAAPTRKSDVYSFSITMWEVFTGKTPYPEVRFDGQIILKIMNGKRPELPAAEVRGRVGLSLAVWSTMEVCWDHSPQKRPPISHVVKILGQNLHPRKKTI